MVLQPPVVTTVVCSGRLASTREASQSAGRAELPPNSGSSAKGRGHLRGGPPDRPSEPPVRFGKLAEKTSAVIHQEQVVAQRESFEHPLARRIDSPAVFAALPSKLRCLSHQFLDFRADALEGLIPCTKRTKSLAVGIPALLADMLLILVHVGAELTHGLGFRVALVEVALPWRSVTGTFAWSLTAVGVVASVYPATAPRLPAWLPGRRRACRPIYWPTPTDWSAAGSPSAQSFRW